MPTLPKGSDVSKLREQAVEQARTPFLAALGAGDLAAQTVVETVNKVRTQLNDRAESARADLNDLPSDFKDLRGRLDPAELRTRLDSYTQSALQLYGFLADRGEDTLERLRTQPQVKAAWNQVETAQDRVEGAVNDARTLADDVLGRVTRGTRSVGEKTARATEKAADEAAESVRDAGGQAATATRSTTRKAANKAAEAKSTEAKSSTPAEKPSAGKATTAKTATAKPAAKPTAAKSGSAKSSKPAQS